MSYSAGYDGNSNSKGAENKCSYEFSGKLQLDGSASCAAQVRVLAFANREEDLSFKESSVKDVTDKGRSQAAALVQNVLEQLLGASATPRPERTARIEGGVLKRKAGQISSEDTPASSSTAAPAEEAEMRQEVRSAVQELQKIRLAGGARTNDAIEILHRLDLLPMTISCLKITKIAMEVNQGHWRDNQVAMIRELSRDLVHRWRALFRGETGVPASAVTPAAIGSQRLRTTAMFLEESCYTRIQAVAPYKALMQGVAERLLGDPQMARDLAVGGISAADFVKKVADERRRIEVLKLKEGMKLKGES